MKKLKLNDGTYMAVTEQGGTGYLDYVVYIERNGQFKKASHFQSGPDVRTEDILEALNKIARATGHGGVSGFGKSVEFC